jgi:hypothetical protein
MTTNKTGVFSMENVNQVLLIESIESAKQYAVDLVKHCDPKVHKENINKALVMIRRSKSVSNLAFGMSNFILAFQGEKVIKV